MHSNETESRDEQPEELLIALYKLTSDGRAKAWCELNIYAWPESLLKFKPDGWDSLSPDEKRSISIFDKLWRALNIMTSAWERSWFWNRQEMMPAEHAQWYENNYGKFFPQTMP